MKAYSKTSKVFRPEELAFSTKATQTPEEFKASAKEKKFILSPNPQFKKG